MTRIARAICLGLVALVASCDGLTPPEALPPPLDTELRQTLQRWGAIPIGPMPAQDPVLVDLGQALMFDKILSGNRDIGCATCHLPSQHAADGLSLAIGTGGTGGGPSRTLGPGRQFVSRNAPSLLNGGLGLFYLFWDGQVARAGFGPPPPGPAGQAFVTPAGTLLPAVPNILAAQAMFPVTNRREMRGERGDPALTTAEKRGALLFFGKAQCSSCHSGALLGGGSFANAGVPQIGPGTGDAAPLDLGRGGLKDQSFYKFAFRVTPLRNVELTAPYMHDGAFPTLEAVVRHYNDVTLALRTYDVAQLAPELRPLYHG